MIKMHFFKTKALLLALVLLLSLCLSSCGGEVSVPDTGTDEGTQSGDQATNSTENVTDIGDAPEDTTPSVYLTFQTTDLEGNAWSQDDLADYDLVMINMFEYWCGPCVGEMPDLQSLYEDYSDQGFMILGVYSDPGKGSDVADTVESTGVMYPILISTEDFTPFRTNYVPTTIFVNGKGEVVGETYVGSKSYDDWAAIIEGLLP